MYITLSFLFFLQSFQNSYWQNTSEWVTKSNQHTKAIFDILAKYYPEYVTRQGIDGYDNKIIDILSEGHIERYFQDLKQAKTYLQSYTEVMT